MKAYIIDSTAEFSGRRRVQALLQFASQEVLNPRDVGLQTVDSIMLSSQNITRTQQPIPVGSVTTVLGTPGPEGRYRGLAWGSQFASQVVVRWATGSTGTRLPTSKSFGTALTGTKSAFAWIMGM